MHDYWVNRKEKFQSDLDHAMRNYKLTKDHDERAHLMDLIGKLDAEIEIADSAIKKFNS